MVKEQAGVVEVEVAIGSSKAQEGSSTSGASRSVCPSTAAATSECERRSRTVATKISSRAPEGIAATRRSRPQSDVVEEKGQRSFASEAERPR
jgi:hypothetical protein